MAETKTSIMDIFSKEISLDFTDPKIIGIFMAAILVGIVFLVVFVCLTLKAQKIAKRQGVMLFNILHIIIFGLPVAVFMLVPFFQEKVVLWCIITAIVWAIPFVLNMLKIGKYGVLFSILQLIFALLVCSVIGTVVVAILLIIGLIFSTTMWASEYFDFYIVDYTTGRTIGVTKTGKGSFVDSDGNYYMTTGTSNEYVDTEGNIYYFKKRR